MIYPPGTYRLSYKGINSIIDLTPDQAAKIHRVLVTQVVKLNRTLGTRDVITFRHEPNLASTLTFAALRERFSQWL